MLRTLLLIVVLVLLAELAVLVWLVHVMGWPVTIVSGLLCTALGGSIARRQRQRVWGAWQAARHSGQAPAVDTLDAMLVLASGVLLMLPGFLTDLVALLLLVAPLRRGVARWLRPLLERRFGALLQSFGVARAPGVPARGAQQGGVVDTEGEPVPDPDANSDSDPGGRPQLR